MPGEDAGMSPVRAHPELVDLLSVACGRDYAPPDASAHAASCPECRGTVRELEDLEDPIALDAELDAELADLDPADFATRRPAAGYPLDDARRHAARILEVAETDAAGACAELRALRGEPCFGQLLVLLCQRLLPNVVQNPTGALALATAIGEEAGHVRGPVPPASLIRAEASILASPAHLLLGDTAEARRSAAEARFLLAALPETRFTCAVAEYFEASAASFQRDYDVAAALLRKARATFAAFGQEHWVGRAVQAEATLTAQRGDNEAALPLFDEALRRLDPVLEAHVVVATLVNKASTLSHLGRMDEARSTYARALRSALRFRVDYGVQVIRNGLAEIDFKRGDLNRALTSFRRLATRALEAGYLEDFAFAQLYVAECLGRLGREAEMRATIRALQAERGVSRFGASPAFDELFTCLDQGELDAGLVAYVREYLEGHASGDTAPYQPLRARA